MIKLILDPRQPVIYLLLIWKLFILFSWENIYISLSNTNLKKNIFLFINLFKNYILILIITFLLILRFETFFSTDQNRSVCLHAVHDVLQKYFAFNILIKERKCQFQGRSKVLMQGKLIAVAYTLRTYWNQFSLGGICKQE